MPGTSPDTGEPMYRRKIGEWHFKKHGGCRPQKCSLPLLTAFYEGKEGVRRNRPWTRSTGQFFDRSD